ncbi:MAG: YraN family protein [Porticoccaceae bacterium]
MIKSLWPAKGRAASAGQAAEDWAARFLDKQGLNILTRNYRCRQGEVDIIAKRAELLVFVEVRLRNHRGFASGLESVDQRKQQRLIKAASLYLHQHFGAAPPPCRFDVVSLATKPDNGRSYDVHWIQDAFRPE